MRSTASPSGLIASPRRAEDLAPQEPFGMKTSGDKLTAMPAGSSPSSLSSPLTDFPRLSDVLETVSLVLYGTCAIPVRLKILLDRLLASLPAPDVKQVLGAFGWTYDDYLRGYIAQESGSMFDKWALVTRDEEAVVLRQFLLFAETRALAQQFMAADNAIQAASDQSQDLKKLLEKSAHAASIMNSQQQQRAVSDLILRQSPSPLAAVTSTKPKDISSAPPAATVPSNATSTKQRSSQSSTVHRHHFSDEQERQSSPAVEQNLPALFAAAAAAAAAQTSSQQNSPLNRLQSMQPYDYRTHKRTPSELERSASTPLGSPPLSMVAGANNHHHQRQQHHHQHPMSQSFALNHSNSSDVSQDDGGLVSSEDDDDVVDDDDMDEDNLLSRSAMNLSSAGGSAGDALAMAQAKQQQQLSRKSGGGGDSSSKRRWDPMVLSTLTTNPSTGKRRVQCHVCLKTFCDKGALKIHFSAVHLREMHKCTVDGCNMMFSSRRSRNRHSANPNPKLHTPNLRRKISPHDGRTANPFPVLPPSALLAFNGTSPSHLGSVLQEGLLNSKFAAGLAANGAAYPSSLLDQESPMSNGMPLSLIKSPSQHPSPSQSPIPEECGNNANEDGDEIDDGGEEGGMNLSMKLSRRPPEMIDERSDNRSPSKQTALEQPLALIMKSAIDKPASAPQRKRKALNPTRVAVEQSDDDVHSSDNDESSMNSADHPAMRNPRNDNLSDDEDRASDLSKDDSADDHHADVPKMKRPKTEREFRMSSHERRQPWQLEVEMGLLRNNGGVDEDSCDETDGQTDEHRRGCDTKLGNGGDHLISRENAIESLKKEHPTDEENAFETTAKSQQIKQEQQTILPSENPLRHLESLSMGAFTAGLLPAVRPGGVSFHAPGLGLADGPIKDEGRESPSNPSDPSQVNINAYRDAAQGCLEIPVDKEDPRRCTACGKVFQNHFGVKTHYQNVHLKLMHKCTVEGCNAAFPSRRSRDRHSANLNLHRKLLSTSSIAPGSDGIAAAGATFGLDKMFPYGHPDFLSRFYDPQNLAEMYQRLPNATNDAGLLFPHSFGAFPHLLSQMPALSDRVSPAASGGSLHSRSPTPPSPSAMEDDVRSKSAPSSPAHQRPSPASKQAASSSPAPSPVTGVKATIEPLSLST